MLVISVIRIGICRSGKIRITAAGMRFQPDITKFVSNASMAAGQYAYEQQNSHQCPCCPESIKTHTHDF